MFDAATVNADHPPMDRSGPQGAGKSVRDHYRDEVARRIRAAMDDAGINTKIAAWRMGVTPGYISKLRSGERMPTMAFLIDFAVKIGADPAILLPEVADPERREKIRREWLEEIRLEGLRIARPGEPAERTRPRLTKVEVWQAHQVAARAGARRSAPTGADRSPASA